MTAHRSDTPVRPDPTTPTASGTNRANPSPLTRRRALQSLAALGVGTATFQRALAAQVDESGQVTVEMVEQAEWITGISLDDDQRERLARSLTRGKARIEALRQIPLDYDALPAIRFDPAPKPADPSVEVRPRRDARPVESAPPPMPKSDDDLAFLPVTELSALLRTRQLTSEKITKIYLSRLKKYDPILKCVVTLTEPTALEQAARADVEIAAGRYRGPLHGIPFGLKDLVAYPGYPTTWGAPQFRDQTLDEMATVARRLVDAGAVLVAKLSLGALAQGDRWFGGRTRNPWNPDQGSSGSSAGSASATAAGLVAFAIGSETLGSIVSPSRRCGTSGLRPTFGRVSRHGCMALSWTMDKIGPIARSIEDCALVFDAIHGRDGLDPTTVDRPFAWPPRRDLGALRIGYVEQGRPADERSEIRTLRELGLDPIPVTLPEEIPPYAVSLMLSVEAATIFDDLIRSGNTDGLNTWPDTFRQAEHVPAVEYLRAARLRTRLIQQMDDVFQDIDLYLDERQSDLVITNLTGHPTAVLPAGFRTRAEGQPETPFAITMTGRLFGESDLLAVAHAYQQATTHHLRRPELPEPEES